MNTEQIEKLYQEIASEGVTLQRLLAEALKKNGILESLFIKLQNEINKGEK